MGKGSILKIGIGAIAVLLLVYFYFTTDRRPVYDWEPNYKIDSKEPYGGFLLYELIKGNRPEELFIEMDGPVQHVLKADKEQRATYLFMGKRWYYSYEDIWALVDFVKRGNNAYILCNEAPYYILNNAEVFSTIYFGSFLHDQVTMSLTHQDTFEMDVAYISDWKKKDYLWFYADSISDSQIQTLGSFDDKKLNYFHVKHGDGNLYFHLSPIVFTNFHLKDEVKLEYANEVFSELGEGPIYWDNFSHIPNSDSEMSQSPLTFILGQESLRWAWYILLGIGIIYLLIYTKRKQRVIPVINRPTNTSVEFVKTIGAMYHYQEAHIKIVSHQYHLFLTYIRTKYGIAFHAKDVSFAKRVSLKSGLRESDIDMILKEAKRLQRLEDIKTKDLIAYNQLTENFYRNCK